MRDGTYTYYTIQHRRTHETPWCKPDEPCVLMAKPWDWAFSSWDSFGRCLDPDDDEEAHKDIRQVWSNTGNKGWTVGAHAIAALKRLRKKYTDKVYMNTDGYGNRTQGSRYQFRVVRMTVSQLTEVIVDPVMEDGKLEPAE